MPGESVLGRIAVDIGGGAFGGNGGPTSSIPGGNGNGADKAAKEQTGMLASIRNSAAKSAKDMGGQPRWWTKALKTMGIQMGIAGILKQSQIFTSTLGSLFQILGAFVDIMLAPWIPVIVPGLRKLADQVPRMRVAAQKFFDFMTGRPFQILSKIWEILSKVLSRTWWTSTIDEALGNVKDKIPVLGPVIDKIGELSGKMGTVGVAISGLAATWAAAKLARYGLQATRYIPFINTFTEPQRRLTKGIDNLFNKTASVLGGLLGKAVDAILVKLNIKAPKAPTVPTEIARNPNLDTPSSGRAAPRTGTRTPSADPGGGPGRSRSPSSSRPSPTSSAAKNYSRGYDAIDWNTSTGGRITSSTVSGFDVPTQDPKEVKALNAVTKLRTWVDDFLGRAGSMAAKGGTGLKSLINEGFQLLGTTIAQSKLFAPIAKTAAAIGSRFLKAIPFLGAAYMTGETTYDLKRIASSDIGWTGDMGSWDAWQKEAKGWAASALGGGSFGSMSILGQWGKHLPGPLGDFFDKGGGVERWKDDARAQGALSSGKGMDFGIRALTGYGGAAASFLPLIGQLAGGLVYEGGRFGTTGMNVPGFVDESGRIGSTKYGTTEMTDVMIDKIIQAFTAPQELTLDGMRGETVVGLR